MSTYTITRKIQLRVIGDEEEKKNAWNRLRDIDYYNYKAMNHTLNTLYMLNGLENLIVNSKLKNKELKKLTEKEINKIIKEVRKESKNEIKELLTTKTSNYIYRDLTQEFPQLPTRIVTGSQKTAESLFKTKFVDIVTGKSSLPTYKKGTPIYTPKIKLDFKLNENNDFDLNWFDKIKFSTVLGRDKSDNRTIIERGLKEEYKICDSSIQIDGTKIFLLLVLQIPKKEVYLNSEVEVGVDLGISSTAVVALNKGMKRLFIDNQILKPRLRLQQQKRRLQKELKYSTGGRGRKRKLNRLEKVKKAESNFVRTVNHKVSKLIIDFALKNNAYKINIENLEGISKEERNQFILRNWSYFELQTMIEQKSKQYGIQVEKIDPAYTSQVCNKCKTKGERISQSEFKCKNEKCNVDKINADYNAAKNIANGGVGLTYNKETRMYFESLDYGEVALPEVEGKNHSTKPKKVLENTCNELVMS